MKKILSLLLAFTLFLGMGTSVFADVDRGTETDPEVLKAFDLIDKTNDKIENEILKAQEAADKLQKDFIAQLSKHEEGIRLANLIEEKQGLLVQLHSSEVDESEIKEIQVLLFEIEVKLIDEKRQITDELLLAEQEIAEITSILVADQGVYMSMSQSEIDKQIKGKSFLSKYEKLTQTYVKQLDKIIQNVLDKTSKMSEQTIAKVAEVGVEAECSWVLIRFADRYVLVDPIHVVGLN
jgi:hypothetical protein